MTPPATASAPRLRVAPRSVQHDAQDAPAATADERLGPLSTAGNDAAGTVLPGRLLGGKWRIETLLGVGGMSCVYAARHRNGNRVAIKVLKPELAVNQATRLRFLREGYIANRVGHQGATAVLDDGASDGVVFLVMELVEGESLEAHCQRAGGKLPPEQVIGLSKQLLEVVAVAHRNNVIHRDIKPANVLVTKTGAIKLLDFGIATLRDDGESSHTASQALLGTPAYMAPEQARGRHREVDARTDVWGVGATMFRMLSGRLLHEAGTAQEVMIATATQPAPSLSSVCQEVPAALAAVVDRALELEPERRFPNAEMMRTALETLEEPSSEPSRHNRSWRRLLSLRLRPVAWVAILVLAGFGALLVFRGVARTADAPTPRSSVKADIGANGPVATTPVLPVERAMSERASGSSARPLAPPPSSLSALRSATVVPNVGMTVAQGSAQSRAALVLAVPAPPSVTAPPVLATSSRSANVERLLQNRR